MTAFVFMTIELYDGHDVKSYVDLVEYVLLKSFEAALTDLTWGGPAQLILSEEDKLRLSAKTYGRDEMQMKYEIVLTTKMRNLSTCFWSMK
jgi:hypothetical protein